jgi:hypothetical protein
MRSCRPERAREVVCPVDADLPRPSLEFLKDIRPSAGGQRERPTGFVGRKSEGLFDEKRSPRGRRRGLADHRTEAAPSMTVVVDGDAPARELDQDAPGGGGEPGPVGGDPALVTVGPPGKSDMQPRTPLPAARAAKDRKDGSGSGQRPAGSDGFDPTCMRVGSGPGDVIVQEYDKRLACGYPGGGSSSGRSEDAANCRRNQR